MYWSIKSPIYIHIGLWSVHDVTCASLVGKGSMRELIHIHKAASMSKDTLILLSSNSNAGVTTMRSFSNCMHAGNKSKHPPCLMGLFVWLHLTGLLSQGIGWKFRQFNSGLQLRWLGCGTSGSAAKPNRRCQAVLEPINELQECVEHRQTANVPTWQIWWFPLSTGSCFSRMDVHRLRIHRRYS